MQFAWHVHHNVLVEALTGPISWRANYIKKEKPESEQALRLKLLKVVQGNLPKEYVEAGEAYAKAGEACGEAREAYAKAREAYAKAREAYVRAGEAHENEINALHAKECPDCPWDGKTIFAGRMSIA